MIRLLILSLLVGCSSSAAPMRSGDASMPPSPEGSDDDTRLDDGTQAFFVEVEPIGGDADDLPPARFGPFVAPGELDLLLDPAIERRGDVVAQRVSPWFNLQLPATEAPARGTMRLRRLDGQYSAQINLSAEGTFTAPLPSGPWRIAFAPDDPNLPAGERTLQLADDSESLSVDLGLGTSIWGRVIDANGEGIDGVLVQARTELGLTSASVTSRAGGWYALRVLGNQRYVVQTTGRPLVRDPTVRSDALQVSTAGLRVDLPLRAFPAVTVTFRIDDADARALGRMRVKLVSRSILGSEDLDARYEIEVRADSQGSVDTRVPPGIYDILIAPAQDDPYSPASLRSVDLAESRDLGTLSLSPLRAARVFVTDSDGLPIPSATVRCSELDGLARVRVATSDEEGLATLSVSRSDIECLVSPPGTRSELASRRLFLTGNELRGAISLRRGEPLVGTVRASHTSEPVARALVRVTDTDGSVLALGITEDDGSYRLSLFGEPTDADTGR